MSTIRRLTGAAYGIHLADQVAIVSVPLVASVAFGASPATIGILVACQSLAHLFGSIPFGILVDQWQLRHLAIASASIALAGGISAVISIGMGALMWFGASITLAGFGTVFFGLTALSIVPRCAHAGELGRANAAIEVPRALCSFAVPLTVGAVLGGIPNWMIFAAACIGAGMAFIMSWSLPDFDRVKTQQAPVLTKILDGGAYVIGHALLLPIALCSVFWNFAFAALLVATVAAIETLYARDPGSFGVALAAFGLAAICGSWLSGRIANRVPPRIILLFGPGSSVVASAGLLFISQDTSVIWLYVLFFILGFGPSMWLVAQNSVRQLVTPPDMLGRVNAVIQTAIYGVRPLGAIAGGFCAARFGVETALYLVLAAYVASFAVSLLSDLRHVLNYQSLRSPG